MTNEKKVRNATGCPACSAKVAYPVKGQIYRCASCEALYGTCYLGESYEYVLPYWVETEPAADAIRYFDITTLGSQGVGRRHGWYDPASKRIVQVG